MNANANPTAAARRKARRSAAARAALAFVVSGAALLAVHATLLARPDGPAGSGSIALTARVVDEEGNPLEGGPLSVRVAITDGEDPATARELFVETTDTVASNGLISLDVGSVDPAANPLLPSVFPFGERRFVILRVGSEPPIPALPVRDVARSLVAFQASRALDSNRVGGLAAASLLRSDQSGRLTGALEVTGDFTAGGNVVLTAAGATVGGVDLGALSARVLALEPVAASAAEKAALAGTSGSPGDANRYVTDSDARLTGARTPTAHASTHEAGGSDAIASLPSPDQRLALAGTAGTPGAANRYVTNADARLSDARAPTSHAASHAPGAGDPLQDYVTGSDARLSDGARRPRTRRAMLRARAIRSRATSWTPTTASPPRRRCASSAPARRPRPSSSRSTTRASER